MPKKELFEYTYFNLKEYLCFCQKNCIKGHKTISPFCFYGMEIHHILNLWRGCNLSSLKKSESKKDFDGHLGMAFRNIHYYWGLCNYKESDKLE